MVMDHPEMSIGDHHMEATVGEQVRLGKFIASIEELGATELRELCRTMAEQVFVVYPAAMRFLAHEAARNLSGTPWSMEKSDELLALFHREQEV